jgi:hypothetical protein
MIWVRTWNSHASRLSITVRAWEPACQMKITSPGNSTQASRQSARSSFATLPVRIVAETPASFRQAGS